MDHSIGGRLVQRVITRRITVVSFLHEYLLSIDPFTAATVIAKKAVLDAKKLGAPWDKAKAEEFR